MGLIRDRGGLDYEPMGEYVTAKRVKKIEDVLEEDEQVMYLVKGGTIDVEGAGSGKSVFGSDRSRKSSLRGNIRTAITDQRIVTKVPQMLGDDKRIVDYRNIIGADVDTGLVNKRLSIQTAGPTYHIQVGSPGKKELREIPEFIRKETENSQSGTGSEVDPTEQLQRLQELHEDDIISDDEFDEKREKILDEI